MFGRGRELKELRAAAALCNDKHAAFGTLAQELAERVTAKSQSLGLDAAVSAAMEELTAEQLQAKLLEMFQELPPEKQAELFLQYLPDDVVRAGLESQRERLRRLADPALAIDQIIADARRTLCLDLSLIPTGSRLEVLLYCFQCIQNSEPADMAQKAMDRRFLAIRQKDGFYRVQASFDSTHYKGVRYSIPEHQVFALGTLQMTSETVGNIYRKLYFGAAPHIVYEGHHYPLDLQANAAYHTMHVGRCLIDGGEVFFDPNE